MRFVAGRGTVAELLARSAAVAEMLPAGGAVEESGKRVRQQAPARQAICRKGCTIGKTLPVRGAAAAQRTAGRGAAAKSHREASKERALAARKERAPAAGRARAHPAAGDKKRERQNPLS